MTRPTVLDMDLVVVPREATVEMECRVDHEDCTTPDAAKSAFRDMLSASPYPTAWDDVRKYVEELERSFAACEADRLERIEQCDRMADDWAVFCASIGVTWDTHEAVACEIEARAEAAEARIAELEKRLADADVFVREFAATTAREDRFDAALAYMDGK